MSKGLDRITLLETFVRIAEAGSISAAARQLGLSQPSVSRQLSELENRLEAQLIRRTTHSLALTDAGAELLADSRGLLDAWESLAEKHLSAQTQIRGALKVVAPVALGQRQLMQIAGDFQRQHPGVLLTWELEDRPIRFAEIGCDCWIKVGPVPDDTLVVRRLATVQRLLVASADFVARRGRPGTPKRAEDLPIIALDPFEGGRILLSREARTTTIAPAVSMRTNNIVALKEAVRVGLGMAVLPLWYVAAELRDGTLVDLLPDWRTPALDIHVAYLPGKHQPLRLRAFLDLLQSAVPELPGMDPA